MFNEGLFIDGFAGGGGASTGIAQAIGREVDIAVNHNPFAIAIHKANHPATEHFCEDIRMPMLPKMAVGHRRVAGAWFSPDCKEFSKAKGGPVKNRSIRSLAWEVVHWIKETRPTVAYLENVEEFAYAAPLDEDGIPIVHLKGKMFRQFCRAVRALGYRVKHKLLRACDFGAPTSRNRLYMVMRCDGMPIVWPKPTHGKPGSPGVRSGRLKPYRTAAECIDWTIRCPSIFGRKKELAEATKHRIAAGVMRYVVNCATPFIVPVTHSKGLGRVHDVLDPLRTVTTANGGELAAVDATLAPHITKFHGTGVGADMGIPMPTVTANGNPARPAGATPLGLVGATLVETAHGAIDKSGKRRGRGDRDAGAPLGVVATSGNHAAVTAELAFLDRQHGKSRGVAVDEPAPTAETINKTAQVSAFLSTFNGSDKQNGGGEVVVPLKTARAGGTHHAVVAAHIEQANTGMVGNTPRKPLSTIVGKGCTQRIVETTLIEEWSLPPEMMEKAVLAAAFLVKYYGTGGDNSASQIQAADRPMDVVTTRARYAVVTVTIDAVTYVIVDIGLRMLKPRELANAQGFPADYVLDPIVQKVKRGKLVWEPLTIAEQISSIGNSVCPPVARALVAANQPGIEMRMAA